MKHLDLFSGIGGFALACQWAGIETIGFVEIDKYCQEVLRKHWPTVPLVEDIRDVEKIKEIVANAEQERCLQCPNRREPKHSRHRQGLFTSGSQVTTDTSCKRLERQKQKPQLSGTEQSARCDTGNYQRNSANQSPALLITAGFPCQPFSVAGKREGKEDDRYLWPETLTVIKAVKPEWVLLENVTGIINLALDTVLSDLEGAGYAYETLIIPACAVNAWHRRDRVWIVANNNSVRNKWRPDQFRCGTSLQSQIGASSEDVAVPKSRESREQTESEGRQGSGRGSQEVIVANTPSTGLENTKPRGESTSNGEPCNTSKRSDWWAVEPELCLLANGLSEELDRGINGRTINVSENCTSFCWGEVQRMWFDYLSRGSPHGWRQNKQLARELANILQRLSYPLALAEWEKTLEATFSYLYRMWQACEAIGALRDPSVTIDEAWQSLSQEDKDWIVMAVARGHWVAEWPNVGRVAKGVKHRVDRLKCLGNAIVPQVAYQIIRVIKEIESWS